MSASLQKQKQFHSITLSNHRPSRLPSFQRHGPPAPSDVIRHAVRLQARRGHAPGRWRCPVAAVLRCGAMSSLVSEQGAFDALCPSYRLASCCRVRTVRILISQALNPELENVCLL